MIFMKLLGAAAAAALVGAVTVAATGGHAAASCTPQTAWYGAENSRLAGNGTPSVVTYPLSQTVTVTSVTVSASMIPDAGMGGGAVQGWAEVLAATGWSSSPQGVPGLFADPALGAPQGFGGSWEGNPPIDGVLAAAILKTSGGQAVNEPLRVAADVTIPGGDYMFVSIAAGGLTVDAETQVEVTYTPAGC